MYCLLNLRTLSLLFVPQIIAEGQRENRSTATKTYLLDSFQNCYSVQSFSFAMVNDKSLVLFLKEFTCLPNSTLSVAEKFLQDVSVPCLNCLILSCFGSVAR